jgi:S1-C subfamily serine protease
MYAQRAIEERFGDLGFTGAEEELPEEVRVPGEQVGLRVDEVVAGSPIAAAGLRAGDLLLEFGGEPFFRGNGGLDRLYQWLVRELRDRPVEYPLTIWRDGAKVILTATLRLGPYADR